MTGRNSVAHIGELVSDLREIAELGRFKTASEVTPLCVELVVIGGLLTVIEIPGLVLVNGLEAVVRIRD